MKTKRAKNKVDRDIYLKCLICGKIFRVKPYRKDTAMYCSLSCKSKDVYRQCNMKDKFTMRGKKAWNKGIKTGLVPRSAFKKGHKTWNKGKKMDPKQKAKLIQYLNRPEVKERLRKQRMHQVFPQKDSKIEVLLQKELRKLKIPFKKHYPIMGQPDMFIKPNICVFVDGVYWHSLPKVIKRDKKVNRKLKHDGYIVIRFTGSDIRNKIGKCTDRLIAAYGKKKNENGVQNE